MSAPPPSSTLWWCTQVIGVAAEGLLFPSRVAVPAVGHPETSTLAFPDRNVSLRVVRAQAHGHTSASTSMKSALLRFYFANL